MGIFDTKNLYKTFEVTCHPSEAPEPLPGLGLPKLFCGAHRTRSYFQCQFKVTDDNLQTIVSNYDECKEWMGEYLKAHEIDSDYAE